MRPRVPRLEGTAYTDFGAEPNAVRLSGMFTAISLTFERSLVAIRSFVGTMRRRTPDPMPTLSFVRGKGSILDADVEALVNPVNCVGVMGKGLAVAFKEAFPEVFREYKRACRKEEIVPGRVHVVRTKTERGAKYVINFPTKRHWRDTSRICDIKAGLVDLALQIDERQITSVAIPALGCGLGGLEWKDVRALIQSTLAEHIAVKGIVRIVLFEPK